MVDLIKPTKAHKRIGQTVDISEGAFNKCILNADPTGATERPHRTRRSIRGKKSRNAARDQIGRCLQAKFYALEDESRRDFMARCVPEMIGTGEDKQLIGDLRPNACVGATPMLWLMPAMLC